MKLLVFTLGMIILADSIDTCAQQLLLARRERVISRFDVGDEIKYSTLHAGKRKGVISSISSFQLIISTDTVNVADIRRMGSVASQNKAVWKSRGYKVLLAGVLLGLGDYITLTVVQGKDYEPDRGVLIVSAALISAGVVMITTDALTRINRSNRLVVIDADSHRYKSR